MLYKSFRKVRHFISIVVLFCIMVPFLSACGSDYDNGLPRSADSHVVGKGGNINAYTTYSQAKFMEMDQDMYYSYLMTARDFILVVLPEGKSDGDEDNGDERDFPDSTSKMFQAVYNGVTPYAEQIVQGNFTYTNPEYKVLIYYVLVEDFLEWEKEASAAKEKSEDFISRALDFMGPASNTVEHDMQNRMVNYTLKNVINMNGNVSECEFMPVVKSSGEYYVSNDYGVPDKCKLNTDSMGNVIKGNVIADVANGDIDGVTLLYGNGGLTGYFTSDDLEDYDLTGIPWINALISEGKRSGKYTNLEGYFRYSIDEYVCNNDPEQEIEICQAGNKATKIEEMIYKIKYDLGLLNRIDYIYYNTVLDFNMATSVVDGIDTKTYKNDLDGYLNLLHGDKTVNGGDYIAYTTAGGFIIDRGNILMQAAEDMILDTDILAQLTMMDACTNRTLASYLVEVLADIGIVVGGIATVAGGALLTAGIVAGIAAKVTAVATLGAVTLSVPVAGWIIGGILLLAAGLIALFASISAKKAINDTSSANYCEVYSDAIKKIIETSYIKAPIYNYNIPTDEKYTTDLCYESYVEVNGVQQCGTIDPKTGEFKKAASAVPVFNYANLEQVERFGLLEGAPSLRLYSDGVFVDEIYGAASPQFVHAILDSWGVTAAANMKYYVGLNQDSSGTFKGFDLYDLLFAKDDRKTEIVKASYCLSGSYGADCEEDVTEFDLAYSNFKSGKYTYKISESAMSSKYNKFTQKYRDDADKNKIDFIDYKGKMEKEANDLSIPVVQRDGKYYADFGIGFVSDELQIVNDGTRFYIGSSDNPIALIDTGKGYYKFVYNEKTYRLNIVTDGEGNLTGYRVRQIYNESLVNTSLDYSLLSLVQAMSKVDITKSAEDFRKDLVDAMNNANTDEEIQNVIDTWFDSLSEITYYSVETPVYLTVTIVEKDDKDKEKVTSTSVLYGSYQYSLGGK